MHPAAAIHALLGRTHAAIVILPVMSRAELSGTVKYCELPRVAYESTVATPAACATLRLTPGSCIVLTTNEAATDATTTRASKRVRVPECNGMTLL